MQPRPLKNRFAVILIALTSHIAAKPAWTDFLRRIMVCWVPVIAYGLHLIPHLAFRREYNGHSLL